MTILKTVTRAEFNPRVDLAKITVEVSGDDEAKNRPVQFYTHSVNSGDILSYYGATAAEISAQRAAVRLKYPLLLKELGFAHFRVYGRFTVAVKTVVLEKALSRDAQSRKLDDLRQLFSERYFSSLETAEYAMQRTFYTGGGWKNQFDISASSTPGQVFYRYAIYDELSKVVTEPNVEYVSSQVERETETIEFSFSTTQSIKRLHDGNIDILYVSRFVDDTGTEALPPQLNLATGEFVSPVKVAGAVVVAYNAPYRLFKVTYALPPDAVLTERVHHGMLYGGDAVSTLPGQESQDSIREIPNVIVAVISVDGAQIVRVPRVIFPKAYGINVFTYTPPADPGTPTEFGLKGRPSSEFLWKSLALAAEERRKNPILSEQSRVTETVNITGTSGSVVSVERAREIAMQDADGKSWTLKLK